MEPSTPSLEAKLTVDQAHICERSSTAEPLKVEDVELRACIDGEV